DKEVALVRFLCADTLPRRVMDHPRTRRALAGLAASPRERMRLELEAQLADPIQIWDDGERRRVEIYGGIRFRMDRPGRSIEVDVWDSRWGWLTVSDDVISLAPFLCRPAWRRPVIQALMDHGRENLLMELASCGIDVTRPVAMALVDRVCR